jgi:UDP-glucuronate 4-epimerase
MTTLVTGAAGFIGYHLCERLLARGEPVLGVDNFSPYYDVTLKRARVARLCRHAQFTLRESDLVARPDCAALFGEGAIRRIVHLAAQPGVRHSLENPAAYVDNNIVAFGNVLEGVRQVAARGTLEHFVFASSSSVYGANGRLPFREEDPVDHPVSLYAATKKANELMAHAYSHLFGIATTALRFFTVYGPWGRPDMAIFKFTRAILAGETIPVFNRGDLTRDYTYVDDIVEGVVRALDRPAAPDPSWRAEAPDPASSSAPFRVYNIGNHQPVPLLDFIAAIERATGRAARLDLQPMQAGDVLATEADVSRLASAIDFVPRTPMSEGVRRFVDWYRDFYRVAA